MNLSKTRIYGRAAELSYNRYTVCVWKSNSDGGPSKTDSPAGRPADVQHSDWPMSVKPCVWMKSTGRFHNTDPTWSHSCGLCPSELTWLPVKDVHMCLYWQMRRNRSGDVLLLFPTWTRMGGDGDCGVCPARLLLIPARWYDPSYSAVLSVLKMEGELADGYLTGAQRAAGPSHPPNTNLRQKRSRDEQQRRRRVKQRQAARQILPHQR